MEIDASLKLATVVMSPPTTSRVIDGSVNPLFQYDSFVLWRRADDTGNTIHQLAEMRKRNWLWRGREGGAK